MKWRNSRNVEYEYLSYISKFMSHVGSSISMIVTE